MKCTLLGFLELCRNALCVVFLCKNIKDINKVLPYFLLSFIIRWEQLVEEEFNLCHDVDILS